MCPKRPPTGSATAKCKKVDALRCRKLPKMHESLIMLVHGRGSTFSFGAVREFLAFMVYTCKHGYHEFVAWHMMSLKAR